jgi:preprotein translocase subunit SecE
MATEEDVKRKKEELAEGSLADELPAEAPFRSAAEPASAEPVLDEPVPEEIHDVAPVGAASPSQMGTRRFVYAGYFAGAIGIAFIMSKAIAFAWHRLQTWKPGVPDPDANEAVVMVASGLIGAGVAVYFWYRTRARRLADEVATEMSRVTWPSRTEVTNGTFVVIVTTIVSTVFFALMDRFWGFLTNLVYGGS